MPGAILSLHELSVLGYHGTRALTAKLPVELSSSSSFFKASTVIRDGGKCPRQDEATLTTIMLPVTLLLVGVLPGAYQQTDAPQQIIANGGGWNRSGAVESTECDIDVREAAELSVEQFRQTYWRQQPVLIRGATDDWPAHSLWTKQYIKAHFNKSHISPEASAVSPNSGRWVPWSKGPGRVPLGEFLDAAANLECLQSPALKKKCQQPADSALPQ